MIHHITLQYAKKSKKRGEQLLFSVTKKIDLRNGCETGKKNYGIEALNSEKQVLSSAIGVEDDDEGHLSMASAVVLSKKKPKMAAFYKKLPKKMGDQPENN